MSQPGARGGEGYLGDEVPDEGVVGALALHALVDVGHDGRDVASAQQVCHAVQHGLLELQLEHQTRLFTTEATYPRV